MQHYDKTILLHSYLLTIKKISNISAFKASFSLLLKLKKEGNGTEFCEKFVWSQRHLPL